MCLSEASYGSLCKKANISGMVRIIFLMYSSALNPGFESISGITVSKARRLRPPRTHSVEHSDVNALRMLDRRVNGG